MKRLHTPSFKVDVFQPWQYIGSKSLIEAGYSIDPLRWHVSCYCTLIHDLYSMGFEPLFRSQCICSACPVHHNQAADAPVSPRPIVD